MNTLLIKDAAMRAANTAWQTVGTLSGAGQVNLFSLSWSHILEAALGAAVLSFVKTLGVAGVTTNPVAPTVSLPDTEVKAPGQASPPATAPVAPKLNPAPTEHTPSEGRV